jgi:hypothetical protein
MFLKNEVLLLFEIFQQSETLAAQRVLYTSFSPELENSSGCYLSDCKITTPASKLLCPTFRLKLWDATLKLLDIEQFGKL